mmetsp:Transcript_13266/g.24876  ORF Transcript_13266/g.24876 Transcript_13266/m.24876 type:complete len:604 (+) Transcript_13266:1597-3408(+)
MASLKMDSEALLYYYASTSSIPLYFCFFALRRIYIHRLDGVQGEVYSSIKVFKFKRFLTFTLAVCALTEVLLGLSINWNLGISTADSLPRLIYFSLVALSWSISYYLLSFDFKRHIELSWINQAFYYIVSIPLYLADVFTLSLELEMVPWHFVVVGSVSNALSICGCILLCYLTYVKPNEFSFIPDEYQLLEMLPPLPKQSFHPEMTNLNVCVEGYKTKLIEGKYTVFFCIVVQLNNQTHIVKHTYAECEALAKHLMRAFPKSHNFRLQMPEFPDLYRKTMDDLVDELSEYFKLISSPIFLTSYFVEFLKLQSCDWVQQEQEYLMRFYTNESGHESTSIEPTYSALPMHVFFQMKITYRIKSDANVEYCMSWICIPNGAIGSAYHRYSNLLRFHKHLARLVRPAKLPSFPSKHYLSRITTNVDMQLIERRGKQLETYYNLVMNDPAFLCINLLELINCRIPLTFIIPACSLSPVVKLNGPLNVEAVWTDDHVVCVYNMSFFKADIDQTSDFWTISQPLHAFKDLAIYLKQRAPSPFLRYYMRMLHEDDEGCDTFPSLPKKFTDKVDKLKNFIEDCLASRHILNCLAFRRFLKEPKLNKHRSDW